ncbi:hypothetical protein F5B20DRAFT_541412 [Whalleya microplaca]|nr:hypothetical protein F5B20DRAFT_541412 [Whalleya microplaca]
MDPSRIVSSFLSCIYIVTTISKSLDTFLEDSQIGPQPKTNYSHGSSELWISLQRQMTQLRNELENNGWKCADRDELPDFVARLKQETSKLEEEIRRRRVIRNTLKPAKPSPGPFPLPSNWKPNPQQRTKYQPDSDSPRLILPLQLQYLRYNRPSVVLVHWPSQQSLRLDDGYGKGKTYTVFLDISDIDTRKRPRSESRLDTEVEPPNIHGLDRTWKAFPDLNSTPGVVACFPKYEGPRYEWPRYKVVHCAWAEVREDNLSPIRNFTTGNIAAKSIPKSTLMLKEMPCSNPPTKSEPSLSYGLTSTEFGMDSNTRTRSLILRLDYAAHETLQTTRKLLEQPANRLTYNARQISTLGSILLGGIATVTVVSFDRREICCYSTRNVDSGGESFGTSFLRAITCPNLFTYVIALSAYGAIGLYYAIWIQAHSAYQTSLVTATYRLSAITVICGSILVGHIVGLREMVDALMIGGYICLLLGISVGWIARIHYLHSSSL